jgi:DNA invertase Pin-like site-specific DNA recombinase
VIYGYARVSTDAQTLDAQTAALTAAGAVKVYSEKESGAKTNRPALARVLASLDAGDVLLVNKTGPSRPKHPGPPKRVGHGL